MGEKIKTLSKAKINNQNIEIELNHPLSKGSSEQIHIQTDRYRLEFSKKDFIQYAFSILAAGKKLKKIKHIDE